jgi:putative transposase
MPRTACASAGGSCYHVLNRGNNRAAAFLKDEDHDALLSLIAEASELRPMRVLAYRKRIAHYTPFDSAPGPALYRLVHLT